MAREVKITSPFNKTNSLISELRQIKDIIEIHLQKGASVSPPADVITILLPNSAFQSPMRMLDKNGLGKEGGISMVTTDPDSVISTQSNYKIDRDKNEASWEEMEMVIAKESNSTLNMLLLMFFAGCVATAGMLTNSLHVVIGGMLIAPGFMPVMRISLGIISENAVWRRGLIDTVFGYIALITGAAASSALFRAVKVPEIKGYVSYYLINKPLAEYWSTLSFASMFASIAVSLAGAVLITTKRSVFTSGVMIGLSLVPSAALLGVGIVYGEYEIAISGLKRWAVDLLIVFVCSLLYFFWERFRLHNRKMNL